MIYISNRTITFLNLIYIIYFSNSVKKKRTKKKKVFSLEIDTINCHGEDCNYEFNAKIDSRRTTELKK